MRVLVAYGSKRGGTEGLARAVGAGLERAGHSVDVHCGARVKRLDRWDAVVVGGALYAFFWHRDARRLVRRHVEELQQLPVWFFSSGPLDESARDGSLPAPPSVQRLARLAGARAHRTFGGRLAPDAKSAIQVRGDFRDLEAATAWGRHVGEELSRMPARQRVAVPRGLTVFHRLALSLCFFTGITAVMGGLTLAASPNGGPSLPPLYLLEHSPFSNYLVPGLLLLLLVGLGNLAAALMETLRTRGSEVAVSFAGAILTGWIVIQLVMLRSFSWLHGLYLAVGLVTLGGALWLWRVRHLLIHLSPSEGRGEG